MSIVYEFTKEDYDRLEELKSKASLTESEKQEYANLLLTHDLQPSVLNREREERESSEHDKLMKDLVKHRLISYIINIIIYGGAMLIGYIML